MRIGLKMWPLERTQGKKLTTDDGHSTITIAHHEHFVLRWAKKENMVCLWNTKATYGLFLKMWPWYLNLTDDLDLGIEVKVLPQNKPVKYESTLTSHTKVIANVTIFCRQTYTCRKTDNLTDRQDKGYMPPIYRCGSTKSNEHVLIFPQCFLLSKNWSFWI